MKRGGWRQCRWRGGLGEVCELGTGALSLGRVRVLGKGCLTKIVSRVCDEARAARVGMRSSMRQVESCEGACVRLGHGVRIVFHVQKLSFISSFERQF
eukprot:6200939-Pleurochrysis_carterae.AAC.4